MDPVTDVRAVHTGGSGMAGMGSAGTGGSAAPAPRFTDVYAIMVASCGGGNSGCHITGSSGKFAMPNVDAAYDRLVRVASAKCPTQTLVVPQNAKASMLVQALEGTSTCVKRMPLGRDPLSEDQIETVRAWIAARALPD